MLLINTCGVDAVVALATREQVVAQISLPARSASEQLVPAMRRLLAEAGTLEAVGVVHGPGSFTGVRVGLSAAKGLCEAHGCGMIAMSRLALVARDCEPVTEGPPAVVGLAQWSVKASDTNVIALLDAGRGEFFCRFPELSLSGFELPGPLAKMSFTEGAVEVLLRRSELSPLLHAQKLRTCDMQVMSTIGPPCVVGMVVEPGAAAMLQMMQRRIAAGDWTDIATTDANYLRRTDAELLAEAK